MAQPGKHHFVPESKRIAVVCGHFMPEVGYLEVYLARAMTRLGYSVRVFTSDKSSPSVKNIKLGYYPPGIQSDGKNGFDIYRLKTNLAIGGVVIGRGLARAVQAFGPGLVVVVGVGKVFPLPLLIPRRHRKYKLLCLFGENADYRNWTSLKSSISSLKSEILQRVLKNRMYARAVKYSDRLCLYTPETESILLSYLPEPFHNSLLAKKVVLSLCYDPEDFFFDEKERNDFRHQMGLSANTCVAITSTRVNPNKRLERIVDSVSAIQKKGIDVHYLIIGFLNDKYEEQLREYISRQEYPDKFHLFPFLGHNQVRRMYSASDMGIWTQPSISIQEAMGTGLPVLLPDKMSLSHLLTHTPSNGWYFDRDRLPTILEKAVLEMIAKNDRGRVEHRKRLADLNFHNLACDGFVRRLLEEA